MIIVGGTKIPAIEELPQEHLRDILGKIIEFAKSNPQGPERETFDFKRKFTINKNQKTKNEIRKDFSSFANTRGGLLIVGIDEHKGYGVANIDTRRHPTDKQLSDILGTDSYIRPSVTFYSRNIDYQDKTVFLYYIPESYDAPIEVKPDKQWIVWGRHNNTTRRLTNVEIMLKFYRGPRKLPAPARINISQLGFYSAKDDSKRPSIKWTIKNQGELYKWLNLSWMPLIPIPLDAIPFHYTSEVYYSSTRWYGSHENLFDIIESIEDKVEEIGISFEVWTVPLGGVKTYLEDHHYVTGCDAQNLKKPSWATAHQRITKIACHSEGAKRPKNLLMQGSRDSSPLAQNDTPIELYFRNKVEEIGISFEVWTVPLGGVKTYLEDHHYVTGCDAQNLKKPSWATAHQRITKIACHSEGAKRPKNLLMQGSRDSSPLAQNDTPIELYFRNKCLEEEVRKNRPVVRFGWILFGHVMQLVTGELYQNHCDIEVQSIYSFIPNNYPFISIDAIGRVVLEPLPSHKMNWMIESVREWESESTLPWAEDISDELLTSAKSAQILGYLGDKPHPCGYDFPFRTDGLTLLELTNPSDKFPEDNPPLIANITPIFCRVSSAPRGLDDLKEIRIGRMKLSVRPISQYLLHDSGLVLFSIGCYVNQSKSNRTVGK